jgi:hypothetical protein
LTFDPRGLEKAMKRAVCPHYGDKPVCDECAQKACTGVCYCGRPCAMGFGHEPGKIEPSLNGAGRHRCDAWLGHGSCW